MCVDECDFGLGDFNLQNQSKTQEKKILLQH